MNPGKYETLYKLLKERKWVRLHGSTNPNYRPVSEFRRDQMTCNVGYTIKLQTPGQPIGESACMRQDKSRIYDECKRLFPDFEFNAVQINKNFKCPPHTDPLNVGVSLLMALGEYTGGQTFVRGKDTAGEGDAVAYDVRYNPITFNGSQCEHWVEDFEGDRYSIVLFNLKVRLPKFSVTIPTKARYGKCFSHTVATLVKGGVPENLITLYVDGEDEKRKYMEVRDLVGSKVKICAIDAPKLWNSRNYILQNHTGRFVVQCDDDLQDIIRYNPETNAFETVEDLMTLFATNFQKCREEETCMWGINPCPNKGWMKRYINKPRTTGLFYGIGTLRGYVKPRDGVEPLLQTSGMDVKEDCEGTCLAARLCGGITRDWLTCVKTKYYAPGGIGSQESRQEENEKACAYLVQKYPDLVKIKRRKNGFAEIAFNTHLSREKIRGQNSEESK